MVSSPIDKLSAECKDDEEESREEYSKVRAIITEMPQGHCYRGGTIEIQRPDKGNVVDHDKVPTRKSERKREPPTSNHAL